MVPKMDNSRSDARSQTVTAVSRPIPSWHNRSLKRGGYYANHPSPLHFGPASFQFHSMSSHDSPWPLFQTVLGVCCPSLLLASFPCSLAQSIIQVTIVCIFGYVLARRGILDKQTQRVYLHLPSYPPPRLISSTATERHQRQLLHPLSPLLQSRLLPFTRSVIILSSSIGHTTHSLSS